MTPDPDPAADADSGAQPTLDTHADPAPDTNADTDVGFAGEGEVDAQTVETNVVVLPDRGQKIMTEVISPAYLATLQDRYGTDEMMANLEEIPEDASMQDSEVEEVRMLIRLFEDEIISRIVRPENPHWADPEAGPDGGGTLNVAQFSMDDLLATLACVTGQDPDVLLAEAEQRTEDALAQTDGGQDQAAAQAGDEVEDENEDEYRGRFRGQ